MQAGLGMSNNWNPQVRLASSNCIDVQRREMLIFGVGTFFKKNYVQLKKKHDNFKCFFLRNIYI